MLGGRGASGAASGSAMWQKPLWDKSVAVSEKAKHTFIKPSAIVLPDTLPKRVKNLHPHKNLQNVYSSFVPNC